MLSGAKVVIVGAGPIGLAHAWGIKKLNPDIEVEVKEKYTEYQRKHTLVMQADQLSKLMEATDTQSDPTLSALLTQLTRDPHIRTSELEDTFKKIAQDSGVKIIIEEVKEDTIRDQLVVSASPNLIIGADGTHSVVSKCLFPEDNQVKHEFDYVLQLRYDMVDSKESTRDNNKASIHFYQNMAQHGLIANEYVGPRSAEGTRPVTMQVMISQEAFYKLRRATSKQPLRLIPSGEPDESPSDTGCPGRVIEDSKQEAPSTAPEALEWSDVPSELQSFITEYLKEKCSYTNSSGIELSTLRISVNEAPATHAKKVVHLNENKSELKEHAVPLLLVGDAGLGLSYFKGLNAGLESTTKLLALLKPAIRSGLSDQETMMLALRSYESWFLREFAPKKVKEVASFSRWRIRPGMGIMRFARGLKNLSGGDLIIQDQLPLIKTYMSFLGTHTLHDQMTHDKEKWRPYPHRPYDLVKFAQLDYVPLRHTVKKIAKLFVDYFKPYKSHHHFKQDLKQPLAGIANLSIGTGKTLAGLVTLNGWQIGDGLLSAVRGTLELVTTPFAWLVKPIIRGLITLVSGSPAIEENTGVKKLVQKGHRLLAEYKNTELSTEKIYNLFALCDDLHRKFDKSFKREQHTSITELSEQAAYQAAHDHTADTIYCREYFGRYFNLFAQAKPLAKIKGVHEGFAQMRFRS